MEKIFGKLDNYFRGEWHLAVLDLQKGRWIIPPETSCIPYLKHQNAINNHILIQPLQQDRFLLVDDISWNIILRHHKHPNGQWKPGRMIVETSSHNFQVWIRSSRPLHLHEKRYWLRKLRSDPGADPNNRWGRCPGFRNRKEKHRQCSGFYPLAKLIWIDWKHQADIPLSDSFSSASQAPQKAQPFSHLPQGGIVCRFQNIARSDYERGNHSSTDFAYALALARRGYSENEIKQRILSERMDWGNHHSDRKKHDYLKRTLEKVMRIILTT